MDVTAYVIYHASIMVSMYPFIISMYPFTTSMYPYYSVNMTQYPNLPEIPWYKATVNAGDCLYLPYKWLHHVSDDVIVMS